jgi:hypothetical protein
MSAIEKPIDIPWIPRETLVFQRQRRARVAAPAPDHLVDRCSLAGHGQAS